MKLITIIDAGHRKDTPGKRANGLEEWEFNEYVAKLVGKEMKKYGEVYFTITTPNHPYSEYTKQGRSKNLNYRTNKANNVYWKAVNRYGKSNLKVVFVSIHANAATPSASGYEVFVYRHGTKAHKLARAVYRQAELVLGVGKEIKSRGIKEANFAVLRNTIMPAILIEHEFYTNPKAARKLKDKTFRQKCAIHICRGILDYAGIKQKKEVVRLSNKPHNWAKKEWNWVHEKGIITGDRPREPITREEMAIVIYNLFNSDLKVSEWAKKYWELAIDNKIVDGKRPQAVMTRQEMAKVALDILSAGGDK